MVRIDKFKCSKTDVKIYVVRIINENENSLYIKNKFNTLSSSSITL